MIGPLPRPLPTQHVTFTGDKYPCPRRDSEPAIPADARPQTYAVSRTAKRNIMGLFNSKIYDSVLCIFFVYKFKSEWIGVNDKKEQNQFATQSSKYAQPVVTSLFFLSRFFCMADYLKDDSHLNILQQHRTLAYVSRIIRLGN
jgi:hypothetical protein